MKNFNALSIRTKLILIILAVNLAIVILIGGTRIVWDIQQERQSAAQELSALSQLLGNRSSAALAFDDAVSAAENLGSLKAIPQMTRACLYRSDGTVMADYQRDNTIATVCPTSNQLAKMKTTFDANYLHIAYEIRQGSQSLGWIYLRSDLSLIEAHLHDQIAFSGLALLAAALLTVLLAGWVQRLISGPIAAVTDVAKAIEGHGDRSLRANVSSHDEIGRLARSFNAMLDALEIQNRQLVAAKDEQLAATARYRSLVESTSAIPWELDLTTWRFLFVGHQAEIVLGYPAEDWYQENFWFEHLHPDDRETSLAYCQSATAQKQDHQLEYRMMAANGRPVWIHDDVQIVYENGEAVRLQGFMFDISERKRHEEAIKNIAAGVSAQTGEDFFPQLVLQLARLFDADYAFIGLLDNNDPQLVNTKAVCAHGKIAPNLSYSLVDTPCANVVGQQSCAYTDHVQELFPEDKLLLEMGVDSYIGTPLFDSLGNPIGLIVILDDQPMQNLEQTQEILQIFAARAAAELERLRAEQTVRKLSLAVEQGPNAIIITDTAGDIEYINPAFTRTTGYSETEAIGANPKLLKSGQMPDSTYTELWRTIKEGRTWTGELYNRKKNGELYWDFVTASPITDNAGHITHFLSIQTDVSERKKMEAELQRHRDKLEGLVEQRTAELKNANKELEAFSYSVSHDLRAPLRAIDGFSQALEEEFAAVFDDNGRDYIARVRAGTRRMGELIDDLLQLSRISRQTLQRQTIDLSQLAEEICIQLAEQEPDHTAQWHIEKNLKAQGDARLLRIVLENMLNNACKYTSKTSQARVEFFCEKQGNDTVYCVRDNGAGFDMAHINKLFGAFQRLHKDSEFPGIGIGLATVQRIIHRHGGRIWAEAEPGKGASFYFTLPDA